MTTAQKRAVEYLLRVMNPDEAHHGDCVGADDEFADLCHECGVQRIVSHPGESAKGGTNELRAHNRHSTEVLPTKTHLARNRDMVFLLGDGDTLIAAPFTKERQSGGGTWYTIGFAEKRGKRVVVVNPDGTLTETV